MKLEQAITIRTLAKFHNLGHVTFTNSEDDTYKISGLRVMNGDDEVLVYTASGKSFSQAYDFINGVTGK